MNFQNSESASDPKPPNSVSDVGNSSLDLVACDDSISTCNENVVQQDRSMKPVNDNEDLEDEKSVNINGSLSTNVSSVDAFEGTDSTKIKTPSGARYGRRPSLEYLDLWKHSGFSR